ncbi:MAG TPA: MBL fold metallo-hydrolase [Nitrospiraceae bacterium]|nr:MBL fold metallo-hydrolase [Nitrospiraceae bacterium]
MESRRDIAATETTLPAGHESPDMANGSVYFIGNATVLIRYAGFTILTDPTFIHRHEQVSIGYGMYSTRLTDPAIEIRDLPPLDLIVLSHFHGDHFDQVAERELDKTLPIVTTLEAVKELDERGFKNASSLETWSSVTIRKGNARLRITSMPGRHGPPLADLVLPEVMGSLLEFQSTSDATLFRIYITGDTLVIDDLKDIPRRYPDINLALLHLGGTRVLGLMVTMDGKQGVELMQIVNPKKAIPIHYNDYDVFQSPLSDFQREVTAAGLENSIHYMSHGETYRFNVPSSERGAPRI